MACIDDPQGVVRHPRQLIHQTIADMDLGPDALAEVEEAFMGAGLL